MTHLKAVLFDIDGTISDSVPLCIKTFRKAVEPLTEKEFSDEEIKSHFGPNEAGTIWRMAPGQVEKGVENFMTYYEEYHEMCPDPFPGIKGLLDDLKKAGLAVAVVTGKGKQSTAISFRRFGLDHNIFDHIEYGSSYGTAKVAGMQHTLKMLGNIRPGEAVYIGDSPGDIISARSAGLIAVAAAWAPTAEREKLLKTKPEHIFYSVADFADWIKMQTSRDGLYAVNTLSADQA